MGMNENRRFKGFIVVLIMELSFSKLWYIA